MYLLFKFSPVLLGFLILQGCSGSQEPQKQLVNGWTLLSDNKAAGISCIKKSAEYGINHLQLSHHIVHDLRDLDNMHNKRLYNHFIDSAHAAGIAEVAVWDHALYDLDYYPQEFRTGPGGTIDLDNPKFWEWFKNDYRRLLNLAKKADVIVLTFIETGARMEEQYSEKLKTKEEKLAALVDTIANIVIDERKKVLYVRTFEYTREEMQNIVGCINRIAHPGVKVMMKNNPHDFFLYHPYNPAEHLIRRPILIEFDCAGEFHGQNIVIGSMPNYFTQSLKHYLANANVIGYVARTDRYGNTQITGRTGEVNLYALYRTAQDTSLSSEAILTEFAEKRYGKNAAPTIVKILGAGEEILRSTFYTLGLNFANHSSFAPDYISNYTRHVSARWLKNPEIYIGKGIDKKFNYWTDIVNHLSPTKYKTAGGRLQAESPEVYAARLLDSTELMNEEYLAYVIKEKEYAVALAEDLLQEAGKLRNTLTAEDFDDIYGMAVRTHITTQLQLHGSMAYFGARIYRRGNEYATDNVKMSIFNGVAGMRKAIQRIKAFSDKVPCGNWNWKDDAEKAELLCKQLENEILIPENKRLKK